ncbi:MAG: efflux RND transporter periplasmic adaptor subunit [Alphaproteobacteria bacterium]|nr:efflux RND transporter periplasmic adaptor subunit [Alphaproteobacteria bacterium]
MKSVETLGESGAASSRRRFWRGAVGAFLVVGMLGFAGFVVTQMTGSPGSEVASARPQTQDAAAAPAKPATRNDKKEKTKSAPNIQLVTAISVTKREFEKTAPVSGEARPVHDVRVYAPATGVRIAEVMAEIGDQVKEGQPLARLDAGLVEAQIQQAEAEVRAAEIEQRRAAEDYARIGPADKDAALSTEEIATRRAAAEAAKAQLAAKKAALEQLKARVQGGYIRAPASGLVIERNARVGEMADNQSLFRIVGDDRLEVAAEVAEPDILSLKPGQDATFETSGGAFVKATLRVPPVAVDSKTRTGVALFDLPKDADIRSGMYLRGNVVIEKLTALAVPQAAISYATGSPSVFVIESGRAHLTPVTLGVRDGDFVAVMSGLKGGETIAAAGGAFLLDGDPVRTVAPDGPPETTARGGDAGKAG